MIAALEKSDSWRREYYSTIGGSNAAAALSLSRFTTRRQVWEKMAGVLHDGVLPPSKPPTDDQLRGLMLEPVARTLLADRLGVEIREHPQDKFVYSERYKFAHSLPDGWLPDGGLVEIKVPRPQVIYKWRLHGTPREHLVQVQHNLAVTGAPYAILCGMCPITMSLEIHRVEPTAAAIDPIMDEERSLYRAVLERKAPDESTAADAFPENDAPTLQILDSPEARDAALQLKRVRELGEDAEQLEKDWKAKLISFARDAHAFAIPGIGRFLHKPQKGRKLFKEDVALADFPALADAKYWDTGKGSRPFRPYFESA